MSTTTPPVSAASKTEAPATAISALTQSLENTSLNTDSKSTPQNTNAQDNNETTENKSDTTSPLMTALTTPVSSDFDVKHPLQFSWTMWYNEPQPRNSKEWTNNVKKILTFDTVEDFWCLFNNLYAPSRLVPGSNYHLFKEGIKPEWEDPANKKGGKWICAFSRPHGNAMANKAFDDAWLWTILGMYCVVWMYVGGCGCVCFVHVCMSPLASSCGSTYNFTRMRT